MKNRPTVARGLLRSRWLFVSLRAVLIVLVLILPVALCAEDLVLVEQGISKAPIVVYKGAPPRTRQAADELADYLEKISGARPEVIEGEPSPLPEHAIWVGFQPVLEKLFPKLDFEFKHPEEILLAANGKHLVLAGRDRWDPDHMQSFGRRPLKKPGAGVPG